MESRACCPTAPSRCTYGISNVKIINLKKFKKEFNYYTIYKYIIQIKCHKLLFQNTNINDFHSFQN